MPTATPSKNARTANGNPVPVAFAHAHQLSVTEAVMWVLCRRRFSAEKIQAHVRDFRESNGRPRVLTPRFRERVEVAQKRIINLIIRGVPAIGTLHEIDHPYHGRRVRVPKEFLMDDSYIELVSGCILPDILEDKHSAIGLVRKYLDVELDRNAFFDAISSPCKASTGDTVAAPTRSEAPRRRQPGARPGTNSIDDNKALEKLRGLMDSPYSDRPNLHAASLVVADDLTDSASRESRAKRLRRKYQRIYGDR